MLPGGEVGGKEGRRGEGREEGRRGGGREKKRGGGSEDIYIKLPYSVILSFPQAVERAVKVLDHIPPYDTHKIGVVYVGQGQVHTSNV